MKVRLFFFQNSVCFLVTTEEIQKSLVEIKTSLKKIEIDIRNVKERGSENDNFVQKMEPFLIDAKSQYDTIDNMYKRMEEEYKKLSEFYSIDSKTTLGEFFTDLKTFSFQFKVIESGWGWGLGKFNFILNC